MYSLVPFVLLLAVLSTVAALHVYWPREPPGRPLVLS
jgi:hypothetical protein